MQSYQINSQKNTWNVIGVMSGTSVDGLDIVAVNFKNKENWQYKILKTISVNYPDDLRKRLLDCIHSSAQELVLLDLDLGAFIGNRISEFLRDLNIPIDLIASHGHTVFHQPDKGMTKQIGDGQTILHKTGIITINDFRTMDILNGGQGAPLVPIGDQYLFHEFDVCLNIGGIANISFSDHIGNRIAFDTGPANLLLNYLSRKIGQDFDCYGENARKGKLIDSIYQDLNTLPFYDLDPPKSIGLEWVRKNILKDLDNSDYQVVDLLHTCSQHIAYHINKAIKTEFQDTHKPGEEVTVLVTGGGAHNLFLMECLRDNSPNIDYIMPSKEIIDYKEALIFAFLGILRYIRKENVLKSATGAKINSLGGTLHNNL